MYLERTSSAKGPNRPPPFRPFSAVLPIQGKQKEKCRVKRRAATATVTFKMQLQFNLSKPVHSVHFQTRDSNKISCDVRQHCMEQVDHSISRTSPGSSNRSPGDLPMPVTFQKSKESMMSRRSARNLEKESVGNVERASIQQCRQNKMLFEDAVGRAESTLSLNQSELTSPTLTSNFTYSQTKSPTFHKSSIPSTYSTNNSNQSSLPTLNDSSSYSQGDRSLPNYAKSSSCSLKSKTNGPTVIGSPLYNKKISLPSEESSVVTPDRTYNHERYKTAPPAIRRHMKDVSSSYKVFTPWFDSSRPPSHHILKNPAHRDHIYLIPQDEDYPFGFQHEKFLTRQIQNWTNDDQRKEQLNPNMTPEELTGETPMPLAINDANGDFAVDVERGLPEVEVKTSPEIEKSAKEEISEKGGVEPSNRKPQPANVSRPSDEPAKPEKEDAAGEETDDSSSLPSRPSSAKYWKRKSWVDDVTVTSSKKSDDEAVCEATAPEKTAALKQGPNSPRKSNADKSKGDPKSPTKSKPEVSKAPNNKTDGPGKTQARPTVNEQNEKKETANPEQVPQEKIEVLNLNDLKKRRTTLPKFICPSSETKSREAAVRDWLETTSIHWAVKTSPLL